MIFLNKNANRVYCYVSLRKIKRGIITHPRVQEFTHFALADNFSKSFLFNDFYNQNSFKFSWSTATGLICKSFAHFKQCKYIFKSNFSFVSLQKTILCFIRLISFRISRPINKKFITSSNNILSCFRAN